MNEKEKFEQINREARATGIVLVLIVLFWAVAGLGLSHSGIVIYHTPLWIITGCIGTWLFAIAAVIFLVKKVFRDIPFDDEEEDSHADD